MKTTFLLLVFLRAAVSAADLPPMGISLLRANILERNTGINWEIILTNSAPTAVRLSCFSLSSALRAARFTDSTSQKWRIVRPTIIIDPPSPESDFQLSIPAHGVLKCNFYTDKLERMANVKFQGTTEVRPDWLRYVVEREVEIMDVKLKKSAWVICNGTGTNQVSWPNK